MSDRWIPVLAAVVGVLGGIGGAGIGGCVANQGEERRLNSERQTARLDSEQDAYASYLEAVNTLVLRGQLVQVHPDQISDEDIDNAIQAAFAAQATVEIFAPLKVRQAALELTTLVGHDRAEWSQLPRGGWDEIFQKRNDFIDRAQKELEPEPDG